MLIPRYSNELGRLTGCYVQGGALCIILNEPKITLMTKRELALAVAESHLGAPYKWGGNDSIEGFDCSGLIVEVLHSSGILARDRDMTAAMLAAEYEETDVLEPGNLVFYDWNKDGRIDHVEMIAVVDDMVYLC